MLSRKAVTVRHTILAVGAVLVLGMTIYLVREINRSPSSAQAETSAETREPKTRPTPVEPPAKVTSPTAPTKATDVPQVATDKPRPPVEEVEPPSKIDIELVPGRANPKLDAIMAEANRHYDNGDFDDAKQIALKVLEKQPANVRMLRIVVSSECIAGDSTEAQKYFMQLPVADRAQMKLRCDRYGVTLKEP